MAVILISDSKDVYFNLATEEFLLHHFEEDAVLIYENEPSVVMGKHQNAFAECSLSSCEQLGIKPARRLSGGGTVYHGPGNINFSFIQNLTEGEAMVDFKKHLQPVLDFLHSIGVMAEFSGRNDLMLNGFKISGNAEHVFQKKKRLIHHGTLLFKADLHALSLSIRPKTEIVFKSHAVQSVRSPVMNISETTGFVLSKSAFVQGLAGHLKQYFGARHITLAVEQIQAIQDLVKNRFSTWDWIYGYSPAFEAQTANGWTFKVRRGIIEEAFKNGEQRTLPDGKSFTWETLISVCKEDELPTEKSDWF